MAQRSSPPLAPLKPLDLGEKESSTPQTSIKTLEDPESTSETHGPTTSMNGALPDLLGGAFLPCVPVVLVSTLLLTLILYHRVDLDPGWQLLQTPTTNNVSNFGLLEPNLGLKPGGGGHAAYYVRFNPAILATIAAWSSKIIPYITGYLMSVIAFFAARRILDASRNNKSGDLPTPHQMSILIDLLGPKPKSLWNTIVYRWQNHERIFQPIPMAFAALSYILIIS